MPISSTQKDFEKIVRLYYKLTRKHFGDLFIRLNYDGVRFDEFIRSIIEGYLNQDPDFMKYFAGFKERLEAEFVSDPKKKNRAILKLKNRNAAIKEYREGVEIESFFDLSEKEKESIFDEFDSE